MLFAYIGGRACGSSRFGGISVTSAKGSKFVETRTGTLQSSSISALRIQK